LGATIRSSSVQAHFVIVLALMSMTFNGTISSKCIWAGDKVIAGCPCKEKKVWDVPEEPKLSKEEIKQRRKDRE
jgi:hypothetical protein